MILDININVSEDLTNGLHECIIHHYWNFVRKDFRFQPKECDGCYDMTHKSKSFNYITVVTIVENGYRIQFWFINKNNAVD